MKRIRVIGVCLIAAFAISAVASSVATAAPEFYAKTAVGTTAGPIAFSGTLGAAFLEGKGGTKITCTAGSAAGEATSATKTENNTTTFTGCATGGFPCHSAGQAEGTIQTENLAGSLGAVGSKKDGIRLYNQSTGKGGTLAAFACAGGTVNVVVTGSVIGELTGASGLTVAEGKLPSATQDLTFAETKGIQKYTKFTEGEGGTEQLSSAINGGTPELSGQSVKVVLATSPKGQLGYTEN